MVFSWKRLHISLFRRCSFMVVGLLFLASSPFSIAAQTKILTLASQDSPIYKQIASIIKAKLNDSDNAVFIDSRFQLNQTSSDLSKYDLILTIGTKAANYAFTHSTDTKILSTFIPKSSFNTIISRSQRDDRQLHSALFLEQPLSRQLQLLKLVCPDAHRLGTIVSEQSKHQIPSLSLLAEQQGMRLVFNEVFAESNPVEILSPIISDSDGFLALPDRAVFNRSTAKWILLMTFRQKIPLIAFSKSYVDAGALAAIYSTPETVGTETAEIIQQWIKRGQPALPQPSHPKHFKLSINYASAHSLGIDVPDESELIERLSLP